jgi:uncharacterized repeat protein (TIGR04138 family)
MSVPIPPILQLLKKDPRYKLEAYQFVREALDYAQHKLGMGSGKPLPPGEEPPPEAHLTGQQLCEAIRRYALEQYGYMAKIVLSAWGVHSTGDFGEIVFNLIDIKEMRKSEADRREDFDDVYDFEEAFVQRFEIKVPE